MADTFALTATRDEEPIPVTNQEEKELRRVFVLLSDYGRKVKIYNEMEALEDLLSGNKNRLNTAQKKDQIVNLERFENNAEATTKRIDELKWELDQLASAAARNERAIGIPDVAEMLKRLNSKVSYLEFAVSSVPRRDLVVAPPHPNPRTNFTYSLSLLLMKNSSYFYT